MEACTISLQASMEFMKTNTHKFKQKIVKDALKINNMIWYKFKD